MKNVTKKMVSAVLILSLLLSCGSFAQAKATTRLSKSTATLKVGRKTTLTLKDAKGRKINASKVKWSSTDKKIAKVSTKGTVTGVKVGLAKVTAKYKSKKYTCEITVKANLPAGKEACSLCDGSGLCWWCNGTKKDAWNEKCSECGRTGICPGCNGTGIEQYYEPPATNPPATNPPVTNPSATASPTTKPSATASPTVKPSATVKPTTKPSATASPSADNTGSGYSVKASDGTTITAKRGQTAIHSCQSYPGKKRSGVKIQLPNYESYTGGEFVVQSEEKYQAQWSMGFSYEGLNGYTPVPSYRTDYIMPFGSGGMTELEDYIKVLEEFGFKVVETGSYGFGLGVEYFLRYQGTESITGNICCTYNSIIGKCTNYDMYISFGDSLTSNTTIVIFEYPVEVGFEMDSVKAMTQDTSVASTYYAASSRTFFASGGNMAVGECIDVEVNESKLKKELFSPVLTLRKSQERKTETVNWS